MLKQMVLFLQENNLQFSILVFPVFVVFQRSFFSSQYLKLLKHCKVSHCDAILTENRMSYYELLQMKSKSPC